MSRLIDLTNAASVLSDGVFIDMKLPAWFMVQLLCCIGAGCGLHVTGGKTPVECGLASVARFVSARHPAKGIGEAI